MSDTLPTLSRPDSLFVTPPRQYGWPRYLLIAERSGWRQIRQLSARAAYQIISAGVPFHGDQMWKAGNWIKPDAVFVTRLTDKKRTPAIVAMRGVDITTERVSQGVAAELIAFGIPFVGDNP